MDAHVLVPLKRIDPKSRLAGELPLEERVQLMRGLLAGVVGAVRDAGVERVTIVTGLALKDYDVWDDRGLPWNDALAAAIDEVVIDHYEEDWSKLWWVRLRGTARIVEDPRAVELLAAKYPQYRGQPPTGPVIAVEIEQRTVWPD